MELDDNAAILASAEFFEVCDDEQRRLLAFASERQDFSPGDALYRSGESVAGAHILVAGVVAAEEEGARPYEVRAAGSLLGTMALLVAKPRPVTLVARTAVETLFVPRAAFRKLMLQSPAMAQRAAQRIQSDLSRYLSAVEPLRGKFGRERG